MLIVLEGLDGAGKSTQVKMLREHIAKSVPQFEYLHFPRYDAPVYGELISKFLRGDFGDIESVHPQLVALLYAEDRHGAAPQMKQVLEGGGTVLLDRYVYSNIAYQCAKLSSEEEIDYLRKWILDTEFGAFGLPRPDVNIFLDVPIGFVKKSLEKQRNGHDRDYLEGHKDIHEADIRFQMKVRDIYRRQAGEDSRFRVVSCEGPDGEMLPAEVIFQKILEIYEGIAKN